MAKNDTRRVTVEIYLTEDMDDPTEVPWSNQSVRAVIYQAFDALEKVAGVDKSLSKVGRITFPDGEYDDPPEH